MRGIVVVLFIIVAIIWYGICRLKRVAKGLGVSMERKKTRVLSILISGALLILLCAIWNIGAIAMLHFFGFSMVVDLIWFIGRRFVRYQNQNLHKKHKKWLNHALLRRLHDIGVFPLLATIAVLIFGYYNMMHVVETEYTVTTKKNISMDGKAGYDVALLADLHYGVSLNRQQLQDVCDKVSKKNVDLVVLGGDVVDESTTKEQMEEFFAVLSTIKSKDGIFFVYGNHDRQLYSPNPAYTEEELENVITSAGISILQDEIYQIDSGIALIGREDLSYTRAGRRASLEELLSGVEQEQYQLVLDHQPADYAENKNQKTDLILSGHTHGGQFWPANLLFELFNINDAVYGMTSWEDSRLKAIVTSGIAGWQYPIKTSAPAEYVIVHINKE